MRTSGHLMRVVGTNNHYPLSSSVAAPFGATTTETAHAFYPRYNDSDDPMFGKGIIVLESIALTVVSGSSTITLEVRDAATSAWVEVMVLTSTFATEIDLHGLTIKGERSSGIDSFRARASAGAVNGIVTYRVER